MLSKHRFQFLDQRRKHRPGTGHAEVRCRSARTDVEVLFEDLRLLSRQIVYAYEEDRLKFQSFNMLNIKYTNIIFLPNDSAIHRRGELLVVVRDELQGPGRG